MAMSESAVTAALREAGWPEDVIPQALCIAKAESGYDNWAVGDRGLAPGSGPSYGLFQIDSAFHSDFDLTIWYGPLYNCQYALKLWEWNGKSFDGVWSTAPKCAGVGA